MYSGKSAHLSAPFLQGPATMNQLHYEFLSQYSTRPQIISGQARRGSKRYTNSASSVVTQMIHNTFRRTLYGNAQPSGYTTLHPSCTNMDTQGGNQSLPFLGSQTLIHIIPPPKSFNQPAPPTTGRGGGKSRIALGPLLVKSEYWNGKLRVPGKGCELQHSFLFFSQIEKPIYCGFKPSHVAVTCNTCHATIWQLLKYTTDHGFCRHALVHIHVENLARAECGCLPTLWSIFACSVWKPMNASLIHRPLFLLGPCYPRLQSSLSHLPSLQ